MTDLLTILDADLAQFADFDSMVTLGTEIERDGTAGDARIGQIVADIMRQAKEDAERRMANKEDDPDTGKPIDETTVQKWIGNAVEAFAKRLHRSKTYAYDRGDLFRFYGRRTLAFFHTQPVGKEHLTHVMRAMRKHYPDLSADEQAAEAVRWIGNNVLPELTTVRDMDRMLGELVGKGGKKPLRFDARAVQDEDGRWWFQPLIAPEGLVEGGLYAVSARQEAEERETVTA